MDATLFAGGLQFMTQRIEGRRTKPSTNSFGRTPHSLLKPLNHKDINDLGETIMDHSHCNTCTLLRLLKASHSKEHANLPAPWYTGSYLLAGITLHVFTPAPNHTPHNPKTVMFRAHLYKGEPASPSRYTPIFTTLLGLFSQFPHWLDRRSANVSTDTLRSTTEDAMPPCRNQLPIIRAFYTTVATQHFSPNISRYKHRKFVIP